MSDSIVPMINTKLLYKRSDESYVSLNETFTFPQVMLKLRHKFATKFWISIQDDWQNGRSIIITGIKTEEISTPRSEITFLAGGIGKPFATINYATKPGRYINCLFTFYVSPRSIDDVPKVVEEYFESEFNVKTSTWNVANEIRLTIILIPNVCLEKIKLWIESEDLNSIVNFCLIHSLIKKCCLFNVKW